MKIEYRAINSDRLLLDDSNGIIYVRIDADSNRLKKDQTMPEQNQSDLVKALTEAVQMVRFTYATATSPEMKKLADNWLKTYEKGWNTGSSPTTQDK